MKYIIDVPNNGYVSEEDGCLYIPLRSDGCDPCMVNPTWLLTGYHAEPYIEPDRKAIEDEVWEFVRELIHCNNGKGMSDDELQSCFGYDLYSQVFKQLSYQEAKAKYDEWKEQKEEIHVGDEVEIAGTTAVVVRVPEGDEKRVHYISPSGTVYCNNGYADIVKTGRHFSEVEKLLERMREQE